MQFMACVSKASIYDEAFFFFLVNFCQFAWYFKNSRLSLTTAISNTLLQRQSAVPPASTCCFLAQDNNQRHGKTSPLQHIIQILSIILGDILKAANKRRYCLHDQLCKFYDSMTLCKKIPFKIFFFQLFWVQTIPVHCIKGKSQFPKTGDFKEQQFCCPTGGYTAVSSRSKTPSPQTGPAWDF